MMFPSSLRMGVSENAELTISLPHFFPSRPPPSTPFEL